MGIERGLGCASSKEPNERRGQNLHRLFSDLDMVPLSIGVPDSIIWRPQPRHPFSIQGCYDWWRRDHPRFEITASKMVEIWKPKIPLKEEKIGERFGGSTDRLHDPNLI
ncbi:hypothetical protein QJS10_CPA05g01036 [Acorus calamus]|uniref:Uncharacterized protein n=1 Tax=Acorus calamus TaxID=4465 RepID=A0AAV9ES51_ACOCL|nr:hypothetical protein QJS10_CPA05g01036 [Acorus calamus]